MAFYSRHFEHVEFCLNRVFTALAILIFKGIAAFVHDEQRNLYKNCRYAYYKSKPRAARFAVSTDVRGQSPEQVILAMLIFAVLYN